MSGYIFAEACYTGGLPLSIVENPLIKDFFKAIRRGWHNPSACHLASKLLDMTRLQRML